MNDKAVFEYRAQAGNDGVWYVMEKRTDLDGKKERRKLVDNLVQYQAARTAAVLNHNQKACASTCPFCMRMVGLTAEIEKDLTLSR